jgi:hypothetical protein
MKKYINMSLLMALIAVFSTVLTSCGDDDDDKLPAKPVVTLTEVGHNNLHFAHPGHDLHLEATIVAEGLIKSIDIEIHGEGDNKYEIKKSYTEGKYIGVRNTDFHEHIDISADIPNSDYHLHFTVTDMKGQQTTAESHIEVNEEDGDEDDDDDDDHDHDHEHENE